MDPLQLETVGRWRGAYGRLMVLAAQAMKRDGTSRDAVRYALAGEGDHIRLEAVRRQRAVCNGMLAAAIGEMSWRYGIEQGEGIEECVRIAREVREAVEGEWGHSQVPGSEEAPWDHLILPVVQVRR